MFGRCAVEGNEVMVEKLQASLAEIGFDRVKVSLGRDGDLLFTFIDPTDFTRTARMAVWKASALIFPTSYVCWSCFENNAGFKSNHHCGFCRCCS